ncbi:MAG: hypothetical protein KGS72_20090 [Cyanobacteria bacterium REEB67]|nr:hypothetical protein [Cyanobacteria bacterium REEB67]
MTSLVASKLLLIQKTDVKSMLKAESNKQTPSQKTYWGWLLSFLVPFIIVASIVAKIDHQKMVSDSGKNEVIGITCSDAELWGSAFSFSLLFALPVGCVGTIVFALYRAAKRRS